MHEPGEEERLRRLAERLDRFRQAQEPAPPASEHHTQAQIAWRMVTEMVAGLLVGLGIGYGLDALFGTRPWLMVVFTLLGFAAGVQTMLRTAREVRRSGGADRVRGGAALGAAAGRPGGEEIPAPGAGRGQEEGTRRG